MARGFLTSRLSDHIGETDEGYLIVRDCPIARTGFQEYAVCDLPQDSAHDLGVDLSNPSATIDLYRPASEVFSEDFIRSLNGKPITDGHPEGMVNPDNFQEHSMGHIENVRKGKEALEDGEWPLIADLVICAEPLISEVRNKTKREISLGYDYAIAKDGDKIDQVDMQGNHCAIVPHGRAGSSVRIHDSAPAVAAVPQPKKEKNKVAKLDWKHIFGLGIRAAAADADIEPGELAELATQQAPPPAEEVEDKKAKDKKKARDTEEELEEEEPVLDKKKAKDRKLNDHRQRMHDTLDRLLDGQGEEEAEASDTDLEELKKLLSEFFSEEEGEAAHQVADEEPVEPASTKELDKVLAGKDEQEEELEEEEDEVEAPGEEVEPDGEEELEEEEEVADGKAKDRAVAADAAASGAAAVLKMLRRSVAQCKDSNVKQDFNRALRSVTRTSHASTSSYGAFAGAARSRTDKLPHNPGRAHAADSSQDAIARMQAAYDAAHKGGK
jgi:hypothetical protein